MFQFQADDFKSLGAIYGQQVVTKASRSALNDTARQARTAVSKETRRVFNVSASKVRAKSFVTRNISRGARAEIFYKDNRPHLGRFATRAAKVRVKVKKSGGTKAVRGGFRIRKFGDLIWKRLTPTEAQSTRYRGRRLKIKVLRTIAVPEMVRGVSGDRIIQTVVREAYERRFDYHFRRQLARR